ncbi:hypothetical protein J4439_04935 [Candidatus Woesearchaeota archaeon]|nr:hypothetical protein [Candidatus Woesearchaeota archaeon]
MRAHGVLLALAAVLSLLALPVLAENCTSQASLACAGNAVYWFDSCGNQEGLYQGCSASQECVDGKCQEKCGNGQCDPGEGCNTCWFDCECGSSERCESNKCVGWCGNGRCDSSESCGTCFADCGCPSGEECSAGRCVTLCGNHRQDVGESCDTCLEDFPCTGAYCYNGRCVECVSNANCESRDSYLGEFVCDPANRRVLEKGVQHHGVCKYNSCSGESEPITRVKEDCGSRLCQDGRCGCRDGYVPCIATGKCERERTQGVSQACGCDAQCAGGYCNGEVCIDALNVVLSATRSVLSAGDEFDVTVSADNNLNEEVNLNLALNIGSGLSISGVLSGMDCSGNQCKLSRVMAARAREKVIVTLRSEGAAQTSVGASATYIVSGKERSIANVTPLELTAIQCGDGVCTTGETLHNCCGDCGCPRDGTLHTNTCSAPAGSCKKRLKPMVYIVVAFLWFVLIIAYLFSAPTIRYVIEKKRQLEQQIFQEERANAQKEEREKQREHERQRIRHVLAHLEDELDPAKPPSSKEMLAQLGKHYDLQFDSELFGEEYFEFTEQLEARVKQKASDQGRAAKFCTKCGYRLRDGVKFCTICGTKVRFR